jgi:peptide-methionine (S)-S-oxide reductase
MGARYPRKSLIPASSWVACLLLATGISAGAAERLPAPGVDVPKKPGEPQIAVLAGGCFWGVEGVFEHVRGVQTVESGYAGGDKQSAHYDIVSAGGTQHAESVRIVFDPGQLSYGEILQIFFSVAHDPTQLNRQGPDRGRQYRSVVFNLNTEQRDIATRYIAQLDAVAVFPSAVVTRVDPLKAFYPAEAHHQNYLEKHPTYPYIVYNDLPKLRNLERLFPDVYRAASSEASARD